jgi:hypothetical protein
VGAWDDDDMMTGTRRIRTKRHADRRPVGRIFLLVLGLLVVAAAGGIWWYARPKGLATLPNPAVVAPGGFRASIGDDKTITVGLEIQNTAKSSVTVLSARIVPPVGVRQTALTILPSGVDNQGFTLSGTLPSSGPVTLGTGDNSEGVIAARFSLDCAAVLASAAPTDEQIFVTIKVGTQSREEELTPPVVGTSDNPDQAVPWLTATARQACGSPGTTSP